MARPIGINHVVLEAGDLDVHVVRYSEIQFSKTAAVVADKGTA